ncbi:oxygenase MpaB family protein [Caulobacter segnis]
MFDEPGSPCSSAGSPAVILELAEPRVRTGVWSTQLPDRPAEPPQAHRPGGHGHRSGARSTAEAMIAGVGRQHARVAGTTPDGTAYRADGGRAAGLGASHGQLRVSRGHHGLVEPLSDHDRDRFLRRSRPRRAALRRPGRADQLQAEWDAQLAAMLPRLERSGHQCWSSWT